MSTREYEVPVDVPAQQMFDYLSDPEHLREFLSTLSLTQVRGGAQEGRAQEGRADEGVRVDAASRKVWWATSSVGKRSGEVAVHEAGGDRCRVELSVHGDERGDELRVEFEQAVAAIAHGAAAHTDAMRADHQDGWSG